MVEEVHRSLLDYALALDGVRLVVWSRYVGYRSVFVGLKLGLLNRIGVMILVEMYCSFVMMCAVCDGRSGG